MAGRRKLEAHNLRSLTKTASGKSYTITLPVEVIRKFGWKERQKLELTVDEKNKKITIRDWKK